MLPTWTRRCAGCSASSPAYLDATARPATAAAATAAARAGEGRAASAWERSALALLGIWLATGVYQVDAAERAVVTRFGRYVATKDPGLSWHIPWPIEARRIVNVESIESFSDQTRMLTSDENQVDLNIAVQYRRAEPIAYSFNVRDPEETLGEVSESAIREIIGRSRLDFVLEEGRQEISAKTKELVQRTLDSYKTGIEVTSVSLVGVSVPEQVQSSQRDAIKAREDKERLALEAQAYSNDILPKARGSASRQQRGFAGLQGADRRRRAGRGGALLEAARRL